MQILLNVASIGYFLSLDGVLKFAGLRENLMSFASLIIPIAHQIVIGAVSAWGPTVFGCNKHQINDWIKEQSLGEAAIFAHKFEHGLCECDVERMRREDPCQTEHKLQISREVTSRWLMPEVFKAMMGQGYDDPVKYNFDQLQGLAKKAAMKVNSARKGMLASQIMMDDNYMEVVYIPKCWRCGNIVNIENNCGCPVKDYPCVPDVERIFSKFGSRTSTLPDEYAREENDVGKMRRCSVCLLGNEPLWNPDKALTKLVKKRKVPAGEIGLLFFGGRCPMCNNPLGGQSTNVSVSVSELSRGTERAKAKKTPEDESGFEAAVTIGGMSRRKIEDSIKFPKQNQLEGPAISFPIDEDLDWEKLQLRLPAFLASFNSNQQIRLRKTYESLKVHVETMSNGKEGKNSLDQLRSSVDSLTDYYQKLFSERLQAFVSDQTE